jgi:hypothetical protein
MNMSSSLAYSQGPVMPPQRVPAHEKNHRIIRTQNSNPIDLRTSYLVMDAVRLDGLRSA